MSLFIELSLEKYSRPVDLSQFETSISLNLVPQSNFATNLGENPKKFKDSFAP